MVWVVLNVNQQFCAIHLKPDGRERLMLLASHFDLVVRVCYVLVGVARNAGDGEIARAAKRAVTAYNFGVGALVGATRQNLMSCARVGHTRARAGTRGADSRLRGFSRQNNTLVTTSGV